MSNITEVIRTFQYDYIYFDAALLLAWIIVLLTKKQYKALLFGAVIAPIIYYIDAGIWWNAQTDAGAYIREYWYNNAQLPHPLGSYAWLKFGADFMMTISYALFTFPWMWIAFTALRTEKYVNLFRYTLLWFSLWLAVPALSLIISLQDTPVMSMRHMEGQLPFWVISTLLGYSTLLVIFRKKPVQVLRILCVGIVGALIMEVPLFLFRIRPAGLGVLTFDALFMLNQAVPWVYLLHWKLTKHKNE